MYPFTYLTHNPATASPWVWRRASVPSTSPWWYPCGCSRSPSYAATGNQHIPVKSHRAQSNIPVKYSSPSYAATGKYVTLDITVPHLTNAIYSWILANHALHITRPNSFIHTRIYVPPPPPYICTLPQHGAEAEWEGPWRDDDPGAPRQRSRHTPRGTAGGWIDFLIICTLFKPSWSTSFHTPYDAMTLSSLCRPCDWLCLDPLSN